MSQHNNIGGYLNANNQPPISGGMTSASSHRQRFQQMQSPGKNNLSAASSSNNFAPSSQSSFRRISNNLPHPPKPNNNMQTQQQSVNQYGTTAVPRGFTMTKRISQVRQDDAIEMKPKTSFKHQPAQQDHLNFQQNLLMSQNYQKQGGQLIRPNNGIDEYNNRKPNVAPTDLHDCTNEEQIDEFEMIDKEEIFDECDEQIGIKSQQMNIGLSRHPKSQSELFNVFHRNVGAMKGQNGQTLVTESAMSVRGPFNQSTKPLISDNNTNVIMNEKSSKAMRDKQNYNEFLRSSSPGINNVRSREGSRSPVTLAVQREAFFGSSFAGNGNISNRPSVLNHESSTSALKTAGGFKNNTFALSNINRLRPSATNSGLDQYGSTNSRATPQDKGPQNFKNLDMGMQIPDQYKNDLEKIEQQQETDIQLDTSIQQDIEDDVEIAETFDLSDSYLPIARDHVRNYQRSRIHADENEQNYNNNDVVMTDQDTIIDQDDDVAEECSAEQDHIQTQQTHQQHDGPVYRFMLANRLNQEQPQQEEQLLNKVHQQYNNDENAVGNEIYNKYDNNVSDHQVQLQTIQSHQAVNANLLRKQQEQYQMTAQSNFPTFQNNDNNYQLRQHQSYQQQQQQLLPQSKLAQPLANKPRTNLIGGFPSQQTLAASGPSNKPRIMTNHVYTAQSIRQNQNSNNTSMTRSVASNQPNPLMPADQIENNNQKGQVCETVEDIQESVVFMSNQQQRQDPEKNYLETPVLQSKYEGQDGSEDPQVAQIESKDNRVNMSKNDNKDSKNMAGDISLNELQSNQSQHYNKIHLENQKEKFEQRSDTHNKFAQFSASQQIIDRRLGGGLPMDFRQGTFRSPLASPGSRQQQQKSNNITESKHISTVKAAETSMKKALLQNQHFYQRQISNQTEGLIERQIALQNNFFEDQRSEDQIGAQQRLTNQSNHETQSQNPVFDARRDTANFFTAKDKMSSQSKHKNSNHQLPVYQDKGEEQSQIQSSNQSKKTHAELQREFLEVQRKLENMKKSTNKQSILTSNPKNGQPSTKKFFGDDTNSQYSRGPQNNSTIVRSHKDINNRNQNNSSILDLDKNLRSKIPVIEKPRAARNVVSTRLTPKSSYGAGKFDGGSSDQNNSTYRGRSMKDCGSSSQARKARMSARPQTHHYHQKNHSKAGNDYQGKSVHKKESPAEPHSQSMQIIKNRKSPAPTQNGVGVDQKQRDLQNYLQNNGEKSMMSAQNFSLIKPGDKRARNARTFIEDEAEMASKTMRGNTKQLQALAELRQRENQTVQTGQVILGRQRSREGGAQYMVQPNHQQYSQRSTAGVARNTLDYKHEKTTLNSLNKNQQQKLRRSSSRQQNQQQERQLDQTSSRNSAQMRSSRMAVGGVYTRTLQGGQNTNVTEVANGEDLDAQGDSYGDVLSRSQSPADEYRGEVSDDGGNSTDEYGNEDGQIDIDDQDYDDQEQNSGSISSRGVAADREEEDYGSQSSGADNEEVFDQEETIMMDQDQTEQDQDGDDEQLEYDDEEYYSGSYDDEEATENNFDFIQSQQNGVSYNGIIRNDRKGVKSVRRENQNTTGVRESNQNRYSNRNPNYSASSEGEDDFDENTRNRRMTTGNIPKDGNLKSHSPPGRRRRSKRNDSQKNSQYRGGYNQNSMRQRSPIDSKSQYYQAVSTKQGQYQNKQSISRKSEKGNAHHLRQQLNSGQKGHTKQRRDSRRGIPRSSSKSTLGDHQQQQWQHSSRKQHRNQPLKININMTGGSNQNPNAARHDTMQSYKSSNQQHHPQQIQQHQHLQQHPQQMLSNPSGQYIAPGQPGNLMYQPQPTPQVPVPPVADPSQQFYLLQQQQQQAQMVVNQMAAAHQSQSYLPNFNNPLANTINQQHIQQPALPNQIFNQAQPVLQHQQQVLPQQQMLPLSPRQQYNASTNQTTSTQQTQQTNQQPFQPQAESANRGVAMKKLGEEIPEQPTVFSVSNHQSQIANENQAQQHTESKMPFNNGTVTDQEKEQEDAQPISWLQNNSQEEIKKPLFDKQEKQNTGAEDEDEGGETDMDEIWKRLRTKEEPQKEKHVENQQNEVINDVNPIKKKKGEAFIFGLEDENETELASKNPFANKPTLRSKRTGAAPLKTTKQSLLTSAADSAPPRSSIQTQKGRMGKPIADNVNEAEFDNSIPLGADYKKITAEQIQAREERLKKIKDEGLIIFDVEADPISGSNTDAPVNIQEAFAAKRRAKMADDNKSLDQDLAVARDTSQATEQRSQPKAKAEKVQKTPQELAQIRKAMMKKRHTPSAREQVTESVESTTTADVQKVATAASTATTASKTNLVSEQHKVRPSAQDPQLTRQVNKAPSIKDPNAALMERLAGGKRTTIDKKEMKKLTRHNYENLPEIKRRKDEERKKQEALEKKERIAKYNKECKARSRAQLKKKREQVAASVQTTQKEEGKATVGELTVTKQRSSQTKRLLLAQNQL